MSQTTARKTAASRETAAKQAATTGKDTAATPVKRHAISPEEAHLITKFDESMARLDDGIAEQRRVLDALLMRMANKAA
ncbi:hypothetical protein [Acidisoma silvae]|uniref:Uncharacterized protein n=1 Tax=Acidisoma silvae TaxID=2802396 RepID=A0A963YSY1_9PROT|nr:hypothetical protein [Acidisoma silvae]MCB8876426.1 hypothetical protein [Acidisoma silvae]